MDTQRFAELASRSRERPRSRSQRLLDVAPDVAGLQTIMVNLWFVGTRENWVLVDAGMPMQASRIIRAAEQRFGSRAAPAAIILTHGHFDHVGSLGALLHHWDVPVYSHPLEMPYLTGESDYPPADPTCGGGLFTRLSPLFPRHAHDFRPHIAPLQEGGTIRELPDWRWIHTPGHTPGHISLFRDADRVLIAGDAFTTQQQESFFAVMTNAQRVHGPPKYLTMDWEAARRSVQELAALDPADAATGHGLPMRGEELRAELHALAADFDERAVPRDGRYVRQRAIADQNGIVYVPPPVPDLLPRIVAGIAVAGLAAALTASVMQHQRRRQRERQRLFNRLAHPDRWW